MACEMYPLDDLKLVGNMEELDGEKIWVVCDPAVDDYVLAWSPSDGQRFKVPCDLINEPNQGFLMAPSSQLHISGKRFQLDSQGEEVFILDEDCNWIFSSVNGSWEKFEDDCETVIRFRKHSPFELCDGEALHYKDGMGIHLFQGGVYAMVTCYKDKCFKLMKWRSADEVWETLDSHPMFCEGFQRIGGEEFYFLASGGRYMMIHHMNELTELSGRLVLVYDLEEMKWHCRTLDKGPGYINVMLCKTSGSRQGKLIDCLSAAEWREDVSLLNLPPLPV